MPKAVRVQISAGLGNQLFQFAAGMALANRLGYRLILDRAWYSIQNYRPKRAFLLDQLDLQEEKQYPNQRREQLRIESSLGHALAAQIIRYRPKTTAMFERILRIKIIQETNPHCYDQRLQSTIPGENIMLNGYWQTTDHFEAARHFLQTLRPVFVPSNGFLYWKQRIAISDSVFVHVRREDYLNFGGEGSTLPVQYFERAAARLEARFGMAPAWFVFSEDLNWCRSHLRFLRNFHVVDYESANRDIEDTHLMAVCNGGIIANSSFSWWGAALGKNIERPVMAPATFSHNKHKSYPDWTPKTWERIPAWT